MTAGLKWPPLKGPARMIIDANIVPAIANLFPPEVFIAQRSAAVPMNSLTKSYPGYFFPRATSIIILIRF